MDEKSQIEIPFDAEFFSSMCDSIVGYRIVLLAAYIGLGR